MKIDNYSSSGKRRRKKTSGPPGLLEVLIDSNFFQVWSGKAPLSELWNKPDSETQGKRSLVRQGVPAMAVDVVLFVLLVLFAPFYRVFRAIALWIRERWWVKFTLGVITGLASVALVIMVLGFIL